MTTRFGLPVGLDSFGTVLTADLLGPGSSDSADTIDLSRGYWENADSSSPSFHYALDGVIEIE